MIGEVRPRCPELRDVLLVGSPEWTALIARGAQADSAQLAATQRGLSSDDAINIQYTCGTTGFPKGATLSHHNILNDGYFRRSCAAVRGRSVCVSVPFYHCFGMVMGNLGAASHGAP